MGTSGRARVVAYNTDALSEEELPDSIWDYADPEWRGRLGGLATNASFQAMVTAMRLEEGDERTREWLEAIAANEPRIFENNVATLEAIAAGEIERASSTTTTSTSSSPSSRTRRSRTTTWPPATPGRSSTPRASGSCDRPRPDGAAARRLPALDPGSGTSRRRRTSTPDRRGRVERLPPLSDLQGPDVELSAFGAELAATLEMLDSVGLTS